MSDSNNDKGFLMPFNPESGERVKITEYFIGYLLIFLK